MGFENIWKSLNLGFYADYESKKFSISAGPFSLENIPFLKFQALLDEQPRIEKILSDMYINREVMWIHYSKENVLGCLRSIEVLEALADQQIEAFQGSRFDADLHIATLFRQWKNECSAAAKLLKTAIRHENDPIDSGMDTSAADFIPMALKGLRTKTYPLIHLLCEYLEPKNVIRQDALDKLGVSAEVLIKYYNVRFPDIQGATIDEL